jgi:hypothetical protein
MLDSRRDCRYRGGAHRSIGVGLGKVTFHAKAGKSSGVPGFPLTLIHPSAWKSNSANFVFTEFYEVRCQACNTARLPPRCRGGTKERHPCWQRVFGGRWDRQTQRTGGTNHS